jgi:hypothetical protein
MGRERALITRMNADRSSAPWRVRIIENGRDGNVLYQEGGEELSFYWAFGGGDVVVSVAVGEASEWRTERPWAADRRDEIIARVAAEVIRQRKPGSQWVIDDTGRFINFIADGPSALSDGATPTAKRAVAADLLWRLSRLKARMAAFVLMLTILAGGVLFVGRSLFTIKTVGAPIGASARAGDFIATPMGRLEPYVPSLDRNHGRDRYTTGLLLHSARDPGFKRYVPVAEGKTGSDLAKARIAGVAGPLVWYDAPETAVIDAEAARILSTEEAQRAPPPPRPVGAEALAALATAERRLEGLLAPPGEEGAPTPRIDGEELFDAAFLRTAPHRDALALEGGGFLLIYHTKRYREGSVVAARVAADGRVLWRRETQLGRVEEALPDAARPAFVGVRPREEGKVPEPLLVVLDAASGEAATHSLLHD